MSDALILVAISHVAPSASGMCLFSPDRTEAAFSYFDLKNPSSPVIGVVRAVGCSGGLAVRSAGRVSCGEGPDLDEVVGEDAVSAPGSGSADAGEFGAVPAVASFDVVDPSFGSGAPFDLVAEGSAVFELAARGAGFAFARDRHAAHAEFVQVAFHRGFAVAAVGGDRARCASGASGDPFDRRGQLRGSGGFPISTLWSRMTPSALSTIWAL